MNVYNVYVKEAGGKGRGVFAARTFRPGEVIEACPMLIFDQEEFRDFDRTRFRDFEIDWGEKSAISFGYGCIYNHSAHPNARCVKHLDGDLMELVALRDISPDEEITYRYSCQLWFNPVD